MIQNPQFWLLFLIIASQCVFYIWLPQSKQYKRQATLSRLASRYGWIINVLIIIADIWIFSFYEPANQIEGTLEIITGMGTLACWGLWLECNYNERCKE